MKKRVLVSLPEDLLSWVDSKAVRHDWSRSKVIEKTVRDAHDRGLDLSAGQARELAEAMGGNT